jgi:hypothetical protein
MKTVSNCPFLFLTNPNDQDSPVYVAKKEWFETMSIGDTYGTYGQSVDTDECGEYDVRAYNFHNGSNWESVIIESIIDEDIDFDVIADEKLISEYWEAIEKKRYDKEEKGIVYFKYDDFLIRKSNWQGSWALFEINEK